MSDNNLKLKWLKPFLYLIVSALLSSKVCADNSTDYSDGFEDFLLIQPAPMVIPECGMNEVYQSCEVDCIDCENRGVCEPQNCHITHCDCRMYFVHVKPGGPCEHVSVCPPRECPENEVYRHCGPYCEACDMAPCRSMECSSRCYCKQGYRRNRETGKCIPEKECPERLTCISNDVLSTSGPVSDHCMLTESETLRVNETIEEEKCYCAKGYKRNFHGWCIEEELCSFVTCLEQTEFQECPRKCNTTCWNYGDPNCKEDGQCYPGCFCPDGYVLNEFFACIPLEMCPPERAFSIQRFRMTDKMNALDATEAPNPPLLEATLRIRASLA
ncbi:Mucin-19 like protein [Argiope bruennichi]|uniref:Mucin-19 like protein n=1 Tax=Argiope bruennichi TaxID=94029 RepID=A0A8T0G1S6_ARGBR|nr:Mucin-19 like protein [Argiope bruennichi]